ncbi:MAG: hypothetical protein ACTSYZ_03100 [Candidatus Helarchaeota archaeon]
MKNKYIHKEIFYPQEKISRYFLPLEIELLPFIHPLFFIHAYFREGKHFGIDKKELKIYAFNNLQIIFNKILKRFLQATKDEYYINFTKRELHKYLIFRDILLNRKYSLNPKIIFDTRNKVQLIIDLYQDLNKLKKQIESNLKLQKKHINIKEQFDYNNFKNLGWQYKVINFLQQQTRKNLSQFINYFLIHGSFATRDFLENWSDLDTLVILNDRIFQSIHNLNYAKKYFRKLGLLCYKIDPLAHHQFMFLTNFDLNYYPSFIFPPVLYHYALLINGQPEITINIRPDKYEKIQIMSNFVNYFREKVLKERYSENNFSWKNDLAHIMLWPSLLLQSKNIYIYKKFSFQRAKREFPQIDFKIVDWATEIMKNWSRPNILKYYPNFFFMFLPFYFNKIIINVYIKYLNTLPLSQNSKEIKIITKKALSFLENSFSLILKKLKDVQGN